MLIKKLINLFKIVLNNESSVTFRQYSVASILLRNSAIKSISFPLKYDITDCSAGALTALYGFIKIVVFFITCITRYEIQILGSI